MEKRYSLDNAEHMGLLDKIYLGLARIENEEREKNEKLELAKHIHENDVGERAVLRMLVADLWTLLCEMQNDGTRASIDTMAALEERVAPYLRLEAR